MYKETRHEMAELCRRMWLLGWAAANDGNMTAKAAENRFLATGTGISKYDMTPDDIGVIDETGAVVWCPRDGWRPSSEIRLHLMCYRERDDIGAVVHAHPPFSTAFACAHKALDENILIEGVLELGEVPLAPYGAPSTNELPDSAAPYIKEHNALLLSNHGALTVGRTLKAAFFRMETLEHEAKISLYAGMLGGAVPIPDDESARLINMRKNYGLD